MRLGSARCRSPPPKEHGRPLRDEGGDDRRLVGLAPHDTGRLLAQVLVAPLAQRRERYLEEGLARKSQLPEWRPRPRHGAGSARSPAARSLATRRERPRYPARGECHATARAASARRRLNRSIRPPRTTVRSWPVYAGWQFEQTSTEIVSAVDRRSKVAPHEEQRASTECRCGCFVTEFLLEITAEA